MPTYMYKAMTPQGQVVKNKINCTDKITCIKKLKENGLTPLKVSKTILDSQDKNKKPRNFKQLDKRQKTIGAQVKNNEKRKNLREMLNIEPSVKKVTYKDIKIFTQDFLLLKKAKFNNIHALTTVLETIENPRFRVIIEDILYGVEAGEFMHTTMEYYSDVFPFVYINLIKVGELSGSLDLSLEEAGKYLEDTEDLKSRVRKILIPNIAMLVGIIILLFVFTIIGVPAIQKIFEAVGSNDELPAITLWFSEVVDTLIKYWYIPTFGILGAVVGILIFINTENGKEKFDEFKYTMPVFGKLVYLLDLSRLLKNVLRNLENGIRMQEALLVSKSVIKNIVMLDMIEHAIHNIDIGKSWIEPFENKKYSNAMSIEMLKIGMQTDLVEMMQKLVAYLDIDIDNALDKIKTVLPEIVMAIVGIVLIFFVIVVLVPCIQIYMGSFLFSAFGL